MTGPSAKPGPERRDGDAADVAGGPVERVVYFADVPNRIAAYLVDAVTVSVVAFLGSVVLSLILGPVITFDLSGDPPVVVDSGLAYANVVMATVVSALYFVLTWTRFGGSPGLRLLGMRIWSVDGGRLAVAGGVVRWLFIGLPVGVQAAASVAVGGGGDLLLLLVVLAWYVVLMATTARSPAKRGLHDLAAHSVVTKEGRAAPWAEQGRAEQAMDVR